MAKTKKLSNPASTGNAGGTFESHIQASFLALMLTNGFVPGMPCWPIVKLKLQAKVQGHDTDDVVATVCMPNSDDSRKILGNIKRTVRISKKDSTFTDVINAAWKDFNNPEVFTKNKDRIALITRGLSSPEIDDVTTLLGQARATETTEEFFSQVMMKNFSSKGVRAMLEAFEEQLLKANNGEEIQKHTIFQFLRHFYVLGYDLGEDHGVVLSLLHSHMSQYTTQTPLFLWSSLITTVQNFNQHSGTITKENISEELLKAFTFQPISFIPKELAEPVVEKKTGVETSISREIAIAALLGTWNEKNPDDIKIIEDLAGETYELWITKIKQSVVRQELFFEQDGGYWILENKASLLYQALNYLFDADLDKLRDVTKEVFVNYQNTSKSDGSKEGFIALFNTPNKYSEGLRKGLAEALAFIANNETLIPNISKQKAGTISILTVRDIFSNADWKLWGIINYILPTFSEAAPDEFLRQVEEALQVKPSPFLHLFPDERRTHFAGSKLTGLIWSLEGLAWDESLLVRACIALADLAAMDPNGIRNSKAVTSLKTIFLPWLPQTYATAQKKEIALKTLAKSQPDVTWSFLIDLLPNDHQSTMGTHQLLWRNIKPENWQKEVSRDDYWKQINYIAELATDMAKDNIDRLRELISHLDKLSPQLLEKTLEILSSENILQAGDIDRVRIWEDLYTFITRHRKYKNSPWALKEEVLQKIEDTAKTLAPESTMLSNRRLFSDREYLLLTERDNVAKQMEALNQSRIQIMKELYGDGGIDSIREFVSMVKRPETVGQALAALADQSIDHHIIPVMIEITGANLKPFVSAYVFRRAQIDGYAWVDSFKSDGWSSEQKGNFLCYLPFTSETWTRVDAWLPGRQDLYWKSVWVNPYNDVSNLKYAIQMLIKYGRPYSAIDCLHIMLHEQLEVDPQLGVEALYSAATSGQDQANNHMYPEAIPELITELQKHSDIIKHETLLELEWIYLDLISIDADAKPIFLETAMANNPVFYHDIVKNTFISSNLELTDPKSEKDSKKAINGWNLLRMWETPPGLQADNSFSKKELNLWLDTVKALSLESGHLTLSLQFVGQVFFHSPSSETLWINETVAEVLNAKDAVEIRKGYYMAIFNSRGVHMVDPTGVPERDLANEYRKKADRVEESGYYLFASTLRDAAKSFDAEADRNIYDAND